MYQKANIDVFKDRSLNVKRKKYLFHSIFTEIPRTRSEEFFIQAYRRDLAQVQSPSKKATASLARKGKLSCVVLIPRIEKGCRIKQVCDLLRRFSDIHEQPTPEHEIAAAGNIGGYQLQATRIRVVKRLRMAFSLDKTAENIVN
ncbi:MAG: hypothetical protein IJY12_03085 [Clostridia bacterium]|nr:hypothetical protein [Clostridia bacterium]